MMVTELEIMGFLKRKGIVFDYDRCTGPVPEDKVPIVFTMNSWVIDPEKPVDGVLFSAKVMKELREVYGAEKEDIPRALLKLRSFSKPLVYLCAYDAVRDELISRMS
jgi:hypothetical protein